jgi:hypothetical protein
MSGLLMKLGILYMLIIRYGEREVTGINLRVFHNHFIRLSTVLFICCMIILILTGGKYIAASQVSRNNYSYTGLEEVNNSVKYSNYIRLSLINNIYLDENSIFDEEIYKKLINIYYDNSMIYEAFAAIMITFLYLLLRSIRRVKFEETHFMQTLILMDYLHRIDGDWVPHRNLLKCKQIC